MTLREMQPWKDVGYRCLGSQRFAGQYEVMADAFILTVKN